MAIKGRIWHGKNVFIAKNFIDKEPLLKRLLHFFIGPFFKDMSGENVGMMVKGRVKGFKRKIISDRDIAKALHKSWMTSLGHKANVLNPDFKKVGIGVKRRKNKFYATQLFYG